MRGPSRREIASDSLLNIGPALPDPGSLDLGQGVLLVAAVVAAALILIPILFLGIELVVAFDLVYRQRGGWSQPDKHLRSASTPPLCGVPLRDPCSLGLPTTTRRRNRTFQAGGFPALPVLKTGRNAPNAP